MQLQQDSGFINFLNEPLQDLIGRAIAKSQNLGRSVLLSYCQPCTAIDPLSFLAAHSKAQQHKFYWQQPQPNLTIAAAGAVATLSLPHQSFNNRFNLARQFAHRYLSDAVTGGLLGMGPHQTTFAPYVLGGFSFHNRTVATPQSTWRGFPAVMFFIPLWLLRQELSVSGEPICTVNVNYCVQPHDQADAVEQYIKEMMGNLNFAPPTENGWHQNSYSCFQESDRSSAAIQEIREIVGERPWIDVVQQVVDLIQRGDLNKVVLARALNIIAAHNFDPFRVVNSLRCSYPECVSFLIDLGADTTFLGATPEVLLQFYSQGEDLHLCSNAVAGSTKRGESLAEDLIMSEELLNSTKDLSEHQIVVDYIRDRLQGLGADLDTLGLPKLLKLFNVQHLFTPITATWKNHHWTAAFDILEQLHPTAAVGGEPRDSAIDFMQAWEVFDRGWYAAPIGWVNGKGEGTFAVGIRSGYLEGDRAQIYAGAGIVADSQFATELGETSLKFEALLRALGVQ